MGPRFPTAVETAEVALTVFVECGMSGFNRHAWDRAGKAAARGTDTLGRARIKKQRDGRGRSPHAPTTRPWETMVAQWADTNPGLDTSAGPTPRVDPGRERDGEPESLELVGWWVECELSNEEIRL